MAQVGQLIVNSARHSDRVRLVLAGLGESYSMDASAEEFHHELLAEFPRLRNGGGYELLRPAGGHNPVYLRAIFMQAKIFVRPLQKRFRPYT